MDDDDLLPHEGRAVATHPGYLVYTAKLDDTKLKCWWCYRGACGASFELSARTFIDVYSNGVMVSLPQPCGPCCVKDNIKFIVYDKWSLGAATGVGCCKPFGFIFPHGCGLCGEAIGFLRCCSYKFEPKCCPCPHIKCISLADMQCMVTSYCCQSLHMVIGLKPGEGERLANEINDAKYAFEVAGNRSPPRTSLMGQRPARPQQSAAMRTFGVFRDMVGSSVGGAFGGTPLDTIIGGGGVGGLTTAMAAAALNEPGAVGADGSGLGTAGSALDRARLAATATLTANDGDGGVVGRAAAMATKTINSPENQVHLNAMAKGGGMSGRAAAMAATALAARGTDDRL